MVFSADIDVGEAVETAVDALSSESRILAEAAQILHRHTHAAKLASPDLPWPPTAAYLSSGAISPPQSPTTV